jgi:hypothetical protein
MERAIGPENKTLIGDTHHQYLMVGHRLVKNI